MRSLYDTGDSLDGDIPTLYQPKMEKLKEVESFFLREIADSGFDVSFDCTAEEPSLFKTINYSTYGGFFMMHPLRGETSLQQMWEAYEDGYENTKWTNWLKERLKNKEATKYVSKQDKVANTYKDTVLVVLAGTNKIKKHTCVGSIISILEEVGNDKVLFKPHPISVEGTYPEFAEYIKSQTGKDIAFCSPEEDLYELMASAGGVATGFASESALFAVVMGKDLYCTDLYQNATVAPFYHINWPLFSLDNPRAFINKAFSSYKSGIVHPDIDSDWKDKIRKYIKYISKKQKLMGNMYV